MVGVYWWSVIYFFALFILNGTIIDVFVREWKSDFLERLIIRLGVGIAFTPLLGALLVVLHIPLDYRIMLASGLGIFALALWVNPKIGFKKETLSRASKAFPATLKTKAFWYTVVLLVLFAITAKMYIGGSFAYSYFEDGDPWDYAITSKYIATQHTFAAPYHFTHYAEPYTQGYQIVMGILAQTNDSIYWTMKFFNALIISFGVLFLYYLARRMSDNEDVALLAAFFLFAVPAWVGHFVFSLVFNMTLFLILLYTLSMIGTTRADKKLPRWNKTLALSGWSAIGAIVLAGMWISHFYTAVVATLYVILWWILKILIDERIHERIAAVGLFGVLLSMLFFIPSYARHLETLLRDEGLGGAEILFPFIRRLLTAQGAIILALVIAAIVALIWWRERLFAILRPLLKRKATLYLGALAAILLILLLPIDILQPPLGTGTRDYTLGDFFIAHGYNMINNPIGIGLVIMTLFCIGLILALVWPKKMLTPKNAWVAISVSGAILALLMVLGTYFSISFVPFRAWTFLGLFVSLVAAFAVSVPLRAIKNPWLQVGAIALIALLVIPTSFLQKQEFNNAQWPDQSVIVPQSQQFFAWMRDGGLPKGSKVFRLCESTGNLVGGYDMSIEPYLKDVFMAGPENAYARRSLDESLEQNKDYLRKVGADYVVIGASCLVFRQDEAQTLAPILQERANAMAQDPAFSFVNASQSEVLFRFR